MKKKIIIGLSLVLVLSLLASCGGIPQADLDAVIAERDAAKTQATSLQSEISTTKSSITTAQSSLTKAQADLKTAQDAVTAANAAADAAKAEGDSAKSQLSTAQSSLTKAQADLAAANKTIADLKAAAGVSLSFTAVDYTNTTYGFTFKYNSSWTDMKYSGDVVIIWLANAQYVCPAVHVERWPKATADTLENLLKSTAYMGVVTGKSPQIVSTEEKTNSYGVKVTAITFKYTASDGTILDAKAYGFIKGDLWFVMSLYQAPTLGTLSGLYPDEVFSTWKFN